MSITAHFSQIIGVFNPDVETFDKYAKRVQIFFKVNVVKDTDMTLTFLALIGAELFNLVTDLVSPKDPEKLPFKDIIDKLEEHYKPRSNIIFSRYVFHERLQNSSENISEYVAALHKLAAKCDFGQFLNDALRDQFVRGVKNKKTQEDLFLNDELTFDLAVKMAISRETTFKEVSTLQGKNANNTNPNSNSLHSIPGQSTHKPAAGGSSQGKKQSSNKQKPNSNANSKQPPNKCQGCLGNHWRSACPYKDAICHSCKVKGHIKPACRNKGSSSTPNANNNKTHSITGPGTGSSVVADEYLYNIPENTEPYFFDLLVNGNTLKFEIDTGTFRTVVPLNIFINI